MLRNPVKKYAKRLSAGTGGNTAANVVIQAKAFLRPQHCSQFSIPRGNAGQFICVDGIPCYERVEATSYRRTSPVGQILGAILYCSAMMLYLCIGEHN